MKRKSALGISDSEEAEEPPKAVSRRASPLPEDVRVKGRTLISDSEDEITKPVLRQRKNRTAVALESDNEEVLAMMDVDDGRYFQTVKCTP